MNAQNLSFLRNRFTQSWTRQRLDSAGATPTAATETVALRTAGEDARAPSRRLRVNGKILTYHRLSPLITA